MLSAFNNAQAAPIAFAVSSIHQFGTLDVSDGTFSQIGWTKGYSFVGTGVSSGMLYALDKNGTLVTIDPVSANVTTIGNTDFFPTVFSSLSDGSLFAVDGGWNLFSINPSSAASQKIGAIEVNFMPFPARGSNGFSDSLAGTATSLYFTLDIGIVPGDVLANTLYLVDPATAQATVIGPTGQQNLVGSGFLDGILYAFSGNSANEVNKIFSLSLSNGAATLVANEQAGNITVNGAVSTSLVASSPEPGTLSLFGIASVLVLPFTSCAQKSKTRPSPVAICLAGFQASP